LPELVDDIKYINYYTSLVIKLYFGYPSLWFSPGTPVSSNKIDCHDITEILLKMALHTISQPNQPNKRSINFKNMKE
jgi:hypothetical protein